MTINGAKSIAFQRNIVKFKRIWHIEHASHTKGVRPSPFWTTDVLFIVIIVVVVVVVVITIRMQSNFMCLFWNENYNENDALNDIANSFANWIKC